METFASKGFIDSIAFSGLAFRPERKERRSATPLGVALCKGELDWSITFLDFVELLEIYNSNKHQ